jgi:transcriptional regulator with XRE-family HTH domain
MRGIKVDAKLFLQVRRARRLTQTALALRAGVSERTVRNAESGRRVRRDFLEYLAAALGVELVDIILDPDELRVANAEAERAERVVTAIHALARDQNLGEFRQILDARKFHSYCPGPAELPFSGEHRGIDGLQRVIDRVRDIMIYDQPAVVSEVRSSGNFVILSGVDHIRSVSTGLAGAAWWHHIYEFHDGKIVRLDSLTDTHTQCAVFKPRSKRSSAR